MTNKEMMAQIFPILVYYYMHMNGASIYEEPIINAHCKKNNKIIITI